jgi:hypothetical protein
MSKQSKKKQDKPVSQKPAVVHFEGNYRIGLERAKAQTGKKFTEYARDAVLRKLRLDNYWPEQPTNQN